MAANMAKYATADAAALAVDTAIQVHGGNGMTTEYGVATLLGAVRAGRIAPVSREMILNFVAQHVLGQEKSYCIDPGLITMCGDALISKHETSSLSGRLDDGRIRRARDRPGRGRPGQPRHAAEDAWVSRCSATRAAGDYTKTFMAASSMASLNMGVYYLVAVATEWRPFYLFTVIFRLVTFTVFTVLVVTDAAPARFFGVAAWEGLGAVATGVALWFERKRRTSVPSNP